MVSLSNSTHSSSNSNSISVSNQLITDCFYLLRIGSYECYPVCNSLRGGSWLCVFDRQLSNVFFCFFPHLWVKTGMFMSIKSVLKCLSSGCSSPFSLSTENKKLSITACLIKESGNPNHLLPQVTVIFQNTAWPVLVFFFFVLFCFYCMRHCVERELHNNLHNYLLGTTTGCTGVSAVTKV